VRFVSVEDHDGVLVLTIDRPPANAMDLALLEEITECVGGVADAPPAALVLAGTPGVFSAGVDLKSAPTWDDEERRRMAALISSMAFAVYGLPCPVVAAVTGHAIAGGLVLALCADFRVASSEGRYGLTEVKVDIAFPRVAIGVVAAELSAGAARRLALGAELCGAQECLREGVFDELTAPDAVLARATGLAAQLGGYPAPTYAKTKRDLRGATIERLRLAAHEDGFALS